MVSKMKLALIILLFCLLISLGDTASPKHGLKSHPMMRREMLSHQQSNIQDLQKYPEALLRHRRNIQQKLREQHRQKVEKVKRSIKRQPHMK